MKLGTTELLIILAVVVVIFGPTQIPKLTKMIGKSVKNLRAGMASVEDEDETEEPKAKKAAKKSEEPWEE